MIISNKVPKHHQGIAAIWTKFNHQNLLRGIRPAWAGLWPSPAPLSASPSFPLPGSSPTKHLPDTLAPPPALLNEDCVAYLKL